MRLSNEDTDKKSHNECSESIKNQRNLLLDYINNNENFILFDEYCDEDLSGAGTYRPEFERLIKDCENKNIDVVLCKSQSRFSRDMEIVEKYINNKFKEWNIRFIGLSDNADTNNFGNKKARQINGLVNEWYLEDVSNNIRSAFTSKMLQGEFISPFASFGYEVSKKDNNKLVVDVVASEVVKEIFNLYLSGLGFMGIAKILNKRGIPSPSLYKYRNGKKLNVVSNKSREKILWNPSAIKTILTNELYLGHLIQGKRTTISYKNHKIVKKSKNDWIKVENTHEAIIDDETFQKVQNAIKERKRATKKSGQVHMFSGKIYCSICNGCMKKKSSGKNTYLVCSNSQIYQCSNKKSIRYDIFSELILDEINKKIDKYFDKDFLDCMISKKFNTERILTTNNLVEQRKYYLDKLEKISIYLYELYNDKLNKVIDLNQFKDLIVVYNKNKKFYKEQLKIVDEKIKSYENSNNNFGDVIEKYRSIKKLDRFIVEEMIDKIYIDCPDLINCTRNIKIKWNLE